MQRSHNKPAPNADNDIGMFARNDFPADQCGAGIGLFVWFDSYQGLAEHLNNFILTECLLPHITEDNHVHASGLVHALSEMLCEEVPNLEYVIQQYNNAFEGVDVIEWIGTFGELCVSNSSWAKDIRNFTMESENAIIWTDREKFIEAIEHFGC